jgi:hypothetical protein
VGEGREGGREAGGVFVLVVEWDDDSGGGGVAVVAFLSYTGD